MRFWKIFAWIALGWALIARRGAGVLLRKKSPLPDGEVDESETAGAQSGPGWRRVSSYRVADPGQKAQDTQEPAEDSIDSES